MKLWKGLLIVAMLLMGTACVRHNNGQETVEEVVVQSESIEEIETENSNSTIEVIDKKELDYEESQETKTAQQLIMEEYIENYDGWDDVFLYDITGDGFPELIQLSSPTDAWLLDVYDFSGSEPVMISGFEAAPGENIYFCQDDNGNRFILSHFGAYLTAGVSYYLCEKIKVMEHELQDELFGEVETYFVKDDKYKYYNAVICFDGEVRPGLGFCNNINGQPESELQLIQYMNEYMKNYEIVDVLSLPDYGEEETFLKSMEENAKNYNYVPEYDYKEWYAEYYTETDNKNVMICGKAYERQSKILYLSPEDLDETFDSDVFNEFPNLKEIRLNEGNEKENYGKIQIKASDWCGQIYKMYIAPEYFELTGDLHKYYRLYNFGIYGNGTKIDCIDFITQFPNLKVAGLYVENGTLEQIQTLADMDNVEVITYSGHVDFFGNMSDEQRRKVEEILADKIFVCVK